MRVEQWLVHHIGFIHVDRSLGICQQQTICTNHPTQCVQISCRCYPILVPTTSLSTPAPGLAKRFGWLLRSATHMAVSSLGLLLQLLVVSPLSIFLLLAPPPSCTHLPPAHGRSGGTRRRAASGQCIAVSAGAAGPSLYSADTHYHG